MSASDLWNDPDAIYYIVNAAEKLEVMSEQTMSAAANKQLADEMASLKAQQKQYEELLRKFKEDREREEQDKASGMSPDGAADAAEVWGTEAC